MHDTGSDNDALKKPSPAYGSRQFISSTSRGMMIFVHRADVSEGIPRRFEFASGIAQRGLDAVFRSDGESVPVFPADSRIRRRTRGQNGRVFRDVFRDALVVGALDSGLVDDIQMLLDTTSARISSSRSEAGQTTLAEGRSCRRVSTQRLHYPTSPRSCRLARRTNCWGK